MWPMDFKTHEKDIVIGELLKSVALHCMVEELQSDSNHVTAMLTQEWDTHR